MNYTVKPEEHELREARDIVTGVIESCKVVREKEESFETQIGWDTIIQGGSSSTEEVYVYFNTEEDWEDRLKTATAYGYAQSLFWEIFETEEMSYVWQETLLDAFGLLFVEEALPDLSEEEVGDVDADEVNTWDQIKEDLSEEIYAGPEISWEINYLIGKKLLEEHDLEELPKLTRSDVVEAGDQIFG